MKQQFLRYQILLVSIILCMAAHADVTINSNTFPDAAFRSWVLNNISGASDGVLTDEEIAAVTEIDCSRSLGNRGNIQNMKGIEYFTALRKIRCQYNQLTALDLTNNTALTSLYCYENQLTTLDVTKNTALTSLYCDNNRLTTLDVKKNTTLTDLRCFDNKLTTLDLSNNTALTSLYCSSNQLKTLDVSKNTNLTSLDCFNNNLTTLDVSKNSALNKLRCNTNKLTTLDLSNNTALTDLHCSDNQLMALDLSNNSSINSTNTGIGYQAISLWANEISVGIAIPVPYEFEILKVSNLKLNGTSVSGSVTSVNGRKYLVFAPIGAAQSSINGKTLTYNYITGNSCSQAASMDVSVTLSYTASIILTGLEINSTTFPDETFRNWVLNNVSGASDGILTDEEIAAVRTISCSGSYNNHGNIQNMKGIEFFTALKLLSCSYNQIANLDVTKNTALTELYCSSNLLTTLDVSKNTALTSLSCYSNQLSSLDVSKNTALTSLSCYSNLLTLLDVTKNTALKTLECSSNQLTSLDVTKNTALTTLRCESNILTTLDITKNTALTSLSCYSNLLSSLDVSKNTALTSLYCYSNQLSSLDVSKNTALTSLSCYSNLLTLLDVTKNTALTTLYCYSNHLLIIDLSNNNSTTTGRISTQYPSLTAVDINAGIAIPVPEGFNMAKVSNLKLSGTSVSGSISTVNGQQYLVFAPKGTAESSINGKTLTYTYSTGNSVSQAASMDVSVTLSYSATSSPRDLEFVSSNPSAGSEVTSFNSMTLNFNLSINTSNYNTSGITLSGPGISSPVAMSASVRGSSVTLSTGQTYTAYGDYTVYVPAGAFKNSEGGTHESLSIPFRVNPKRDILTWSNVSPTPGKVNQLPESIDVVYNEFVSVPENSTAMFYKDGVKRFTATISLTEGNTKSVTIAHTRGVITEEGVWTIEVPEKTIYNGMMGNAADERWNPTYTLTYTVESAVHEVVTINSTTFPDDAFRNWVLTHISGASDGVLTDEEIAAVTSLYCRGTYSNPGNIQNMKGIEYFTALKYLDCSDNQLTALDVSKNTALTDLYCSSNQLTTLDVSKNTELIDLDCSSNQLLYLDLSNNNSIIDKGTYISTQYLSLTAVDISMGIAIPVPTGFNITKVSNLKLNGTSVSGNVITVNGLQYLVFATKGTAESSINGKTLTYTYSTGNSCSQAASMDVSVTLSYTATTVNYSLSIQSDSGGSISYNGSTITNTTRSFTVEQGASSTITITPNTGYRLNRLTVNGTDVTSSVWNNSYTVSNITGNTSIVATFTPLTYSLSIKATGSGSITYNSTATKNTTKTFTVEHGSSATLTISPDTGYRLSMLKVNGTDMTASASTGKYTVEDITVNTTVEATFEQIPTTTYSLSIQSGSGGTVSYEGTSISNTTKSFTINEGSSATINIYPNSGYQLSKLTVNGNNVTSYVTNNQYTINSITTNTVVAVSFAASSTSFTQNGIYYHISSASNKTLNVNSGAYNGHLTIPASVSYDGSTWSVRGAESGVFNSSSITAITWNPSYSINSDAFGTQTNPNLLLYVKSESYAPSNVQNVIVNGKAKKIVLTDAASGNDFDCPEAFTATEISYTHKYRMTTGIGECRGWETIALPFDVKLFTHESKETLIPFKVFSSASSGKPFWLYQLTSNGWQEAATIEANKPYIISMPNNKSYYNNYNMNGEVTFSAKNITVPKTEPIKTKFNDRTFVANFKSQQSAWDIYALNVNNEYSSYNEYLPEGSTFIRELRTVHPFEAFMMSTAANAKDMFGIFEDLTTAIKQLSTIGEDGNKHIRIYNLEGQLVKEIRNVSEKEALKGLRHGLYIVNGKKRIIK